MPLVWALKWVCSRRALIGRRGLRRVFVMKGVLTQKNRKKSTLRENQDLKYRNIYAVFQTSATSLNTALN